jgi:hypothetical protein
VVRTEKSPVGSGDGKTIGPPGAVRDVGGVRRWDEVEIGLGREREAADDFRRRNRAAAAVAGAAIDVDLAGFGLAVGAVRLAVMLVGVMAEMLRCRPVFVLAIHARCRPGELERHDCQQKDEEELFHAGMIARGWVRRLART